MDLNPKPVLIDKNRTNTKRHHFPINDQSFRVTFAKAAAAAAANTQSKASSTASIVPSVPPTGKAGTSAMQTTLGHTNSNNANSTGVSTGENDTNAKPNSNNNSSKRSTGAKKPTSGATNRIYIKTKNVQKPASPVIPVDGSTSRHSADVSGGDGNEAARSKDDLTRAHSSKSKKKLKKLSSRSVGTPKRSKSAKKLKHKRSTSVDADKGEVETALPAEMSAEYKSELYKITQILKAVSAFDAGTSTGNATVHSEASKTRFKFANFTEGGGLVTHKSMHRPLSAGELKQLISSITRVVSLHQLPLNEESTSQEAGALSSVKKTSSASQMKKKKRKPKTPGAFTADSNREPLRTKSRVSSRSTSKSRESIRRGKSKKKSEKPRKTNSDDSSISSTEKDPVKNAAFLRKYFEESQRFANRPSSEEAVAGSVPTSLPERPSSSETKQSKRTSSGNASIPKSLSKRMSPVNVRVLPAKNVLPPTSSPPFQPSVKAFNHTGAEGSRIEMKNSSEPPPNVQTISQGMIVKPIDKRSEGNKAPKRDNLANGQDYSATNVSTTAVAGSPKPQSPVGQDGEKAAASADKGRPAGKTPIIDPTNTKAARQQQIKSIEEVINSKFSGNTEKMKSIWEKTPYLPMTHARFRDIVSTYGPQDANGIKVKDDNQSRPRTPEGKTVKPIAQLKGPPGYWPDSEMTMSTMYNRLNYEHKDNMRKEARQIRKRFRDDATRSSLSRPTTTKAGFVESSDENPNTTNVNDALKYYSQMISRDAKSK